jgi:hypothetical protein
MRSLQPRTGRPGYACFEPSRTGDKIAGATGEVKIRVERELDGRVYLTISPWPVGSARILIPRLRAASSISSVCELCPK